MSDPVDAPPATNGDSFEAAKNNVASAYDSVSNGPVAQNIKEHTAKASSELFLAATRKTLAKPAATGQSLTHYHSFFSELLSWKNPRASAIAYASIVSLIFAARYLDVIRYAFKLSWMALAVTVSAEAVGKLVLNHGLATQMRPRRYYTVARSTLDNMIGDVHELVNFLVIKGQRILFAENIGASAAACIATFTFYHLAKLVPYWGLAVIGTTVAFMVPLVYTSNQELIDHHIKNASHVISTQTAQVRDVAQKQAGHLTSMASPEATTKPAPATQDLELPSPPTGDPLRATEPEGKIPEAPVMTKQEPLITT